MNSKLDVTVSYYESINTKYPTRANLYDLLTTARYKNPVMAVREELDTKRKKELKIRLPTFTPSGLFQKAGADSLIEHTGLICIDIDRKDNLNVECYDSLKERLGKLPYVAFCGRSVSGEGYYAIIPIAYPDKFLRHFRCLQQDFDIMGIIIDPACCDVSRKRFVSYDPNPHINHNAKIYEGLIEEPPIVDRHTINYSSPSYSTDLSKDVYNYIRIIEQKEVDITKGYSNWIRIGYALFNTFGESARALFHTVSRFHPGYHFLKTDKLFSSFAKGSSSNPATIHSFFHFARQYGLDKFIDFWDDG